MRRERHYNDGDDDCARDSIIFLQNRIIHLVICILYINARKKHQPYSLLCGCSTDSVVTIGAMNFVCITFLSQVPVCPPQL